MESKNLYKGTYLQNRTKPTDFKYKYMAIKGGPWGDMMNQEIGINIYICITIHKIDN